MKTVRLLAIHLKLKRDCADWNEVCDKWKKTFHLRQKDLKKLKCLEFLQAWSKLSDCRVPDLINIDFDLIHPNKGHLLFSKWDMFKKTIRNYYKNNIHNEFSKQLFLKITPSTSAGKY